MEDRICYKSSTTRTLKDGKTVLVDAWKPWNEPEKARFRANGRKPELRRCVYSQAVIDDAQGLHREWQWKPIGPEIHEDEPETGNAIRTNTERTNSIYLDPVRLRYAFPGGVPDVSLRELFNHPEDHADEWETIEYVLTGRKEYRNEHEKAIDGLIQRMTSR